MILIDSVNYLGSVATTVTANHLVSSQDNVLVVVATAGNVSGTITGVTYNGVPLLQLANANTGGATTASIFYMLNPPVGSYPVVVTGTNTVQGTAINLRGVDKASLTPFATTNLTASLSLPIPTTGSLVLYSTRGASVLSTEQVSLTTGNSTLAYQYANSGTALYTISATASTAVAVFEPAQAPSYWYPDVPLSEQIVRGSASLAIQTPLTNPQVVLWQNSFLHTVGRLPSAPPPAITFTPSMSTLQDNFHANQLDTSRWSLFTAGGASFVTNPTGAGTVYPASTTSSTDGDISSINAYDLTGSYAFIRIVQPLSLNAGSSDTTFSVRTTGVNSLQFQIEGGTLFAQQIVGGSQTNLKNAPYSNFSFAWLRIREQSGTIFWETSQDSPSGPSGWSTFYSTPNPIAVNSLRVLLAGTSFGVDTNPGQFVFDNLNTLPVGLFDEFEFQPNPFTYYTSDFWYTVGRVLPPTTNPNPTLVAETELQTSQIVPDKITQQALTSATSITSDHLVTSQDTVMLIFASQMGVAQALNSVTLNGVALNALGNPSTSTLTAGAYYVVNPNVGINVISASATLPTALELVVMTLLGVDKKTTTPIITSNSGASGTPSSTINATAANSLLIDFVGSLGTSISENPSQTVFFDQPQLASQAAGSIKLSTLGTQTMSWTTLTSAWVQLVVALEPAQAPSIWFPTIDMRNLSDVITVNNLDDSVNPVGNFYATYGTHPSTYWQNSFLHTIGRVMPPASVVTAQQPLEYQLLGMG